MGMNLRTLDYWFLGKPFDDDNYSNINLKPLNWWYEGLPFCYMYIPAGVVLKTKTASGFTRTRFKRWNGSAWINCVTKEWDSTQWNSLSNS